MFGRRSILGALLFLAGASIAIACGPFFPWQLLDTRSVTLKSTPHNSFEFEAAHFVPAPHDRLKPDEQSSDQQSGAEFRTAELKGIDPDLNETIALMRDQNDTGSAAYAKGARLPEAVRLYTAGAIDFGATHLESADRYFAAVLKLPPKDGALRATWAAYMAGRSAALAGDNAKAFSMFALTRSLANSGVPDVLGLGVASFGEEARIHYDAANALLTAPPAAPTDSSNPPQAIPADPNLVGYVLPADKASAYRQEIASAISLYAQQAAHGSESGAESLVLVARNILSRPDRIDAVVSDPLVERVLVAYALARLNDNPGLEENMDAGMVPPDGRIKALLPSLLSGIEKFGGSNPAGADHLAALAYYQGRYDLAADMAKRASGPLAEWVKAKIALQKGDFAAAAQHYAAASKGFPQAGDTRDLDADNGNLVVGESGTLALARGEYIDALDKLYPVAATYWGDVAYIAERVLTLDELKDFVDSKVPQPKPGSPPTYQLYGLPAKPDVAPWLRGVLARRLMRAGRYGAALSYFDDPKTRDTARAYALAMHEAETDWLNVDRAAGYFAAAKLAREDGMDIMGTEGPPDYMANGGSFDLGIGQDTPKGAYVTPDEHSRALSSEAQPDLRFHYRFIAVDEANRAADLLPPHSQAFAAVLCEAAGWMMETQGGEGLKHAIYRRYVKNGPHVAWAQHFGRDCPAPSFENAAAMQRRVLYLTCRHFASQYRWWFAGGAAALLVIAMTGIIALFRRRSR